MTGENSWKSAFLLPAGPAPPFLQFPPSLDPGLPLSGRWAANPGGRAGFRKLHRQSRPPGSRGGSWRAQGPVRCLQRKCPTLTPDPREGLISPGLRHCDQPAVGPLSDERTSFLGGAALCLRPEPSGGWGVARPGGRPPELPPGGRACPCLCAVVPAALRLPDFTASRLYGAHARGRGGAQSEGGRRRGDPGALRAQAGAGGARHTPRQSGRSSARMGVGTTEKPWPHSGVRGTWRRRGFSPNLPAGASLAFPRNCSVGVSGVHWPPTSSVLTVGGEFPASSAGRVPW